MSVNFYQTTRCYSPEDSHLHKEPILCLGVSQGNCTKILASCISFPGTRGPSATRGPTSACTARTHKYAPGALLRPKIDVLSKVLAFACATYVEIRLLHVLSAIWFPTIVVFLSPFLFFAVIFHSVCFRPFSSLLSVRFQARVL
jgi:hypothetical protein